MKNVSLLLLLNFFLLSCVRKTEVATTEVQLPPSMEKSETPEVPGLDAVRARARSFSKASDPQTRFKAAMAVFDFGSAVEIPRKDRKTTENWNEAQALASRIVASVRKFESDLTAEDVAYISQDNPNALAIKVGQFDTLSNRLGCRKEEFEEMKTSMGSFTASRLRSMVELAAEYESGYVGSYATRALQVLRKNPDFSEIREDVAVYYSALRLDALEAESSRDQRISRASTIWRIKQLLEDTGLTGVVREQQLAKYAKIAPSCFGKVDSKIQDWINESLTRSRGAYLLEQLRQRAWEDLTTDDLVAGDPVRGETVDAWGTAFQKDRSGDELRSAGPDHQFHTGDDVVISGRL